MDARSDLWSPVATLYQMVTGESHRVIDLDEVPQELRTALSRSLKTKPDARYQTAHEFRDSLMASFGPIASEVSGPIVDSPASDSTATSFVGQCPKCSTQNELSRKFCRGCGESLRVSCLSRSVDIPLWENFCGECGGNQKELLATKVAEERRLAESERMQEDRRLAMVQRTAAALQEPLLTNSVGMKFKLIPSGTFEMGHKQSRTVTLT